jgi:AbrB family looped-hinge helix DNA binding protein
MKIKELDQGECMKSTITSKFQTTIPKAVREKLGISIHDSLEWEVEKGRVIVSPVRGNFLRYQGSVKIGAGDVGADIRAARERQANKY